MQEEEGKPNSDPALGIYVLEKQDVISFFPRYSKFFPSLRRIRSIFSLLRVADKVAFCSKREMNELKKAFFCYESPSSSSSSPEFVDLLSLLNGNIAPTESVALLRTSPDGAQLALARWWLTPSWAPRAPESSQSPSV